MSKIENVNPSPNNRIGPNIGKDNSGPLIPKNTFESKVYSPPTSPDSKMGDRFVCNRTEDNRVQEIKNVAEPILGVKRKHSEIEK